MQIYKCEACQKPISRQIYNNGVRLTGQALCLICQAVKNTITAKNERQADFFNSQLTLKYGITKEDIENNINLAYWQSFKKNYK